MNKRYQIYTGHKLSLSEAKKPQQDEGKEFKSLR